VSILEHPVFKALQSETKRERLLYFKAFIEGFEAAMRAVEHFGLEQAKVIHEQTLLDVSKRIEAIAENDE
jgi:hypothetical protein